MVRQLPWKVHGGAARKDQPPKSLSNATDGRATASRSPAPSHHHNHPNSPRQTPTRSRTTPRNRSPSTSPARTEPPKEDFMIEGVDHDDKYRMVEDEFLAVANLFTKHLHAAEYQRLKGLAKSQNAETIQNISRPVTGEMTDLVKRRHAALDTAAKQRRGMARSAKKRKANDSDTENGEEDEQDLPRQPATYLQGLMDSPRKRALPLTSFSSLARGSSFREQSALPFRQEIPTTDSDSDDLDSRSVWLDDNKNRKQGPARDEVPSSNLPPPVLKKSLSQEFKGRLDGPSEKAHVIKREAPGDGDEGDHLVRLQTSRGERKRSLPWNPHTAIVVKNSTLDDGGGEDDDPFARSRARKAARDASKLKQNDTIKKLASQEAVLNEIPSFI